jgi:hypothetical protein
MFSFTFRQLLGLGASAALFAACSSGEAAVQLIEPVESTTTVSDDVVTDMSTSSTTSSTLPVDICTADESRAIASVIEAQTAAISQRDFVAALSYSSSAFRSNISVQQFERMISYEYGFLLKNPSISLTSCQLIGESRDVLVELGTAQRHVMAYVLTPDDGEWFIEVAALLGEIGGMSA